MDSEERQKFEATELLDLAWASYEERLDGPEAAWKAFRFAFSAGMRAGEIARWIPVEERMPDGDGEYWVWVVPHKPQPSSIEPDDMVFMDFPPRATKIRTWITKEGERRFNCGALEFPTHWQPLPAAPEEKNDTRRQGESMTQEEWMRRYRARFVEVCKFSEDGAALDASFYDDICGAAPFEQLSEYYEDDPEGAADEEMQAWQD